MLLAAAVVAVWLVLLWLGYTVVADFWFEGEEQP